MLSWFRKSKVIQKPKTLGQLGEELAQKEYTKLGYEIIVQNEFNKKGLRRGEIDFIAKNKTEIVFVEVKTRTASSGKFGSAEEAVNFSKQKKILLAIKLYLLKNPKFQVLVPRVDVVVMEKSDFDKNLQCAKILRNVVEDTY